MEEFDEELFALFLEETKEDTMSDWENSLLELEKSNAPEHIDALFRAVHTLKGTSITAGVVKMSEFVHKVEDLVDNVRAQREPLTKEFLKYLFECHSFITAWLNELETDHTYVAPDSQRPQPYETAAAGPESQPERAADAEQFQPDTAASPPPCQNAEWDEETWQMFHSEVTDDFHPGWQNLCNEVIAGKTSSKPFLEKLTKIEEASESIGCSDLSTFLATLGTTWQNIFPSGNLLETDVPKLEKIASYTYDWVDQLTFDPTFDPEPMKFLGALTNKPQKTKAPLPSEGKETAGKNPTINDTIRIATDKLDKLFQIVAELAIQNEILKQSFLDGNLTMNTIDLIAKGFSELQDRTMSLRLLPVSTLFKQLEKTARDVARKLDKPIDVCFTGDSLELDKQVMASMKDPLLHIVRNAIDHGIETQDERRALGKAPIARVDIMATPRTSGILLTIKDDGKGIDPDVIKAKAISKGIINQGVKLSKEETFALLFAPGFSTAGQVTEISGRGVGLDVVKTAVEELGGHIHIDSEVGKGTKFHINLPATMNILDAVIVAVSGVSYAIPLPEIAEIINLKNGDLRQDPQGRTYFELRGKAVPLEPLGEYFPTIKSKTIGKTRLEKRSQHIALVPSSSSQDPIAFEIDDIIGQQAIVMRELSDHFSASKGFSGGTILNNGEPGLIIDLPFLAEFCQTRSKEGDHVE